jgi:4-hydroxy-2-oxoheptanedioate aldolase
MNKVKENLKAGKTVVGCAGSPWVENMSILADSDYDFILYDTQHSPFMVKEFIPAIASMAGKNAAPIVRVSANQPDLICFALDAGARGIVVPMVNTKEEAEAMVRACKYAPLGDRSNAGLRGDWGVDVKEYSTKEKYREYLDMYNDEVLIAPMIETQQAIDNIDEILSVDGIDVLLIGPSDLSIELGVSLDFESSEYEKGLDIIAEACKRHGVVPGMYFIPPTMDPNFFVDKGYKFFTMPWGNWATQGISEGLKAIKR